MAAQQRRHSRRRAPPLVYCSIRHSGLEVAKLAAERLRLRFTSLPMEMPQARVVLGLHEHELREACAALQESCRVGRLFAADAAADKGTTAALTRQAGRLAPALFTDGFPRCWLLPEDKEALQAAMKDSRNCAYILKPRNSSEGNGIRLLLEAADVKRAPEEAVVQEYIRQPLLLNGLKFDLRLYVLVKSLRPFEVWLCREGLARFCTEPYEHPSRKNAHKVASFLTNYSLNKRATAFVHSEDLHGGDGSKRSLSSTLPHIASALETSEEEIWAGLDDVVLHGMLPLVPFLLDAERQQRQQQSLRQESPCFSQLFGVDVLFDIDGRPWLLEVNSFPSMSMGATLPYAGDGKSCRCMDDYRPHIHVTSPVDRTVKLEVMCGMLQLLLDRPVRNPDVQADRDSQGEPPAGLAPVCATGYVRLDLGDNATVAEMLMGLGELFGSCCKSGSDLADPFRLRKFVQSSGVAVPDMDTQLRQLARNQGGLTLIPVLNWMLDRVPMASLLETAMPS